MGGAEFAASVMPPSPEKTRVHSRASSRGRWRADCRGPTSANQRDARRISLQVLGVRRVRDKRWGLRSRRRRSREEQIGIAVGDQGQGEQGHGRDLEATNVRERSGEWVFVGDILRRLQRLAVARRLECASSLMFYI